LTAVGHLKSSQFNKEEAWKK